MDVGGPPGMAESAVGERVGRSRSRGVPGFDLLASKHTRPLARPGTVLRASLIERLARRDPGPVVSVAAPAGYGKTTLLSQWAERDGQAFAWVSLDEADNDPKILLSYIAAALDAIQPIGGRVFEAKPGTGGTVTLWANGKLIGEGKMPRTVPIGFSAYAGMDIGRDNGLVVDLGYEDKAHYAFTGTVKKVVFDLKPVTHEDEKALHEHAQMRGIGQGAAG
jgi:hypothetical protein